jgi:hypothetical protein
MWTQIINGLRHLAFPIEHSAQLSVEAVADHLLNGDAQALAEVERTLIFASRLEDALDRWSAEPTSGLKLVN